MTKMTKPKRIEELREKMEKLDLITEEERKFVHEMEKRMPNLSIRHNADRTGKGHDGRLDSGYLRKFRRE